MGMICTIFDIKFTVSLKPSEVLSGCVPVNARLVKVWIDVVIATTPLIPSPVRGVHP